MPDNNSFDDKLENPQDHNSTPADNIGGNKQLNSFKNNNSRLLSNSNSISSNIRHRNINPYQYEQSEDVNEEVESLQNNDLQSFNNNESLDKQESEINNTNDDSNFNFIDNSISDQIKETTKKGFIAFIKKNPWVWGVLAGIVFFLIIIIVILGAGYDQNSFVAYNSRCGGDNGNFISFLQGWEGTSGATCTVNGLEGNKGVNQKDGTITVGHGVTNYLLSSSTDFIESNHYQGYFNYDSTKNVYYMNAGDCIPTIVSDEIEEYGIQSIYGEIVSIAAESLDLDLTQYQIDALTSFNYNLGTGYIYKVLTAYKEYGYEGLWNEMKLYTKSGGNELDGLKKRRKAEFALFVTGDYSDQELFYSRDLIDYDYYDSENVINREKYCSTIKTNGLVAVGNFLARLTRPLRDNSIYYNQNDPNQYVNGGLEGECAWYGTYRAKEILINNNSSKEWNSNPNGGSFCYTTEVTSGTFLTSKNINEPKAGSLISWSNGSKAGHVAVVEEVYEDGSILISEAYVRLGYLGNSATKLWKKGNGGNKARKENCEGNGSGCFQTRLLTKDQIKTSGWGGNYNFVCYIYINEDEKVGNV